MDEKESVWNEKQELLDKTSSSRSKKSVLGLTGSPELLVVRESKMEKTSWGWAVPSSVKVWGLRFS